MKRGDVYWINLDPTIGSEIKKKRPCVLVGASPINKARHTVVIVPLSSSPRSYPPITIPVKCMNKDVVAVCDQIRAVDKSRLFKKMDILSESDMDVLDDALKQVLSLG
jgi:mRNA interferase MazF